MSVPFVAVIVVGTNDAHWLEVCFDSLTSSFYSNLLIVFVDNASTDGSPEAVTRAFPGVEVLRNEKNLGFAGANNRGMSYALDQGAGYVILINPDTRTPADLIGELVGFLEDNPAYGIVGPMQSVYGLAETEHLSANSWTRHALENGERHVFHHWAPALASEAGPTEGRAPGTLEHAYVQGAAFAIRGAVARQVGLFDATYHTFYEEVDLCRRVRWAGYQVALLKGLWIEHAGGSESEGPPSLYRGFYMTRNRLLYLFTDPNIHIATMIRLTASWIRNDVTVQLPLDRGLVANWAQYARIWGSLAGLGCYIVRTRLRNKRLSPARHSTAL